MAASGRGRSEASWKCPGFSLQTQPGSPSTVLADAVAGRGSRPNCIVPGQSACVQGLLSPRADVIGASPVCALAAEVLVSHFSSALALTPMVADSAVCVCAFMNSKITRFL